MEIKKYMKYWLPILILIFIMILISKDLMNSVANVALAIIGFIGLKQLVYTFEGIKEKRELESNDYAFSILKDFRKIINEAVELNDSIVSKKLLVPSFGSLPLSTNFSKEEMKNLDNSDNSVLDSYINTIIFNQVNKDVYNKLTDIFNSIEEVSAKIIFSENYDHEALIAIRKAYIEIIEAYSPILYICIHILGYNFLYTKKLYHAWKPKVGDGVSLQTDPFLNWRSKL